MRDGFSRRGRFMVEHPFGGPWTEIKLDAVEYYLKCYTKALKRVGFDLWYIDAFAGTGTRDSERVVGGLFEGIPIQTVKETLAGSARRAVAVRPPFDHFVFIEMNATRCEVLADIQSENPNVDIKIIRGEANEVLRNLVHHEPWVKKDTTNSRGVVFLDPYALHVDWETLKALALSRVFDVWYLFPIRDTIRQLAHNFEGIGPKRTMLDRLLGPEWRALYSIVPEAKPRRDLFDQQAEPVLKRVVSVEQFEQWLKRRLEHEFSFVSEPLPLLTSPTRQAFSLFLGVSNPSRPAIELAEKFVRYVNRHFAPGASRRKSAP
jgi:three-Cys-motif partner protein